RDEIARRRHQPDAEHDGQGAERDGAGEAQPWHGCESQQGAQRADVHAARLPCAATAAPFTRRTTRSAVATSSGRWAITSIARPIRSRRTAAATTATLDGSR